MDKELVKNIDALAVNYMSLKTLKRETLNPNNPIVKYYNDNIMDNNTKHMEQFMGSFLGTDIEKLKSGDFLTGDGTILDGSGSSLLGSHSNFDNLEYNMFEQFFKSKEGEVELNNTTLQEILEHSYKLYADLENYNMDSDSNILPMIGIIFGDQVKSDEIINLLKNDFMKSFNYIINHTDVNNEIINHIKLNMLKKELAKAVSSENYLEAAKIKDKIDKIK